MRRRRSGTRPARVAPVRTRNHGGSSCPRRGEDRRVRCGVDPDGRLGGGLVGVAVGVDRPHRDVYVPLQADVPVRRAARLPGKKVLRRACTRRTRPRRCRRRSAGRGSRSGPPMARSGSAARRILAAARRPRSRTRPGARRSTRATSPRPRQRRRGMLAVGRRAPHPRAGVDVQRVQRPELELRNTWRPTTSGGARSLPSAAKRQRCGPPVAGRGDEHAVVEDEPQPMCERRRGLVRRPSTRRVRRVGQETSRWRRARRRTLRGPRFRAPDTAVAVDPLPGRRHRTPPSRRTPARPTACGRRRPACPGAAD